MIAKLHNYQCWIKESDPQMLKSELDLLLDKCDFEKLGFIEHHFKPQGFTCLWLLGESHLAIHTYPEHHKAYIELTSCAQEKNDLFKNLLHKRFSTITSEKENISS